MRFAEPHHLHFLWLALAAFIWVGMSLRAKRRLKRRLGDPALIARLSQEASPRLELAKGWLLGGVIAFMAVALARPQWGETEMRVVRKGIDIMIALDTSKSMLAEDFKPNRLEASKRAIRTLMDRLEGDRVGLMSFAGKSFVQAPLTLDYGAARLFLDSIDVDAIPRPGTALGVLISDAAHAFETEERKHKALVIFSDGEDHGTEPIAQAERVHQEGIRIYCVGFGTLEGAPIPLRDEEGNVTGSKKDREGRVVISKLEEDILRDVALAAGGAYYRATRRGDEIDALYGEISQMEQKELKDEMTRNFEDRFQWLAGLALLGLFVEFFIPQKRRVAGSWTGRS
ncbi:MAG: VWA domain-containing protein [Candidatus Omnitrophica bacterium]|nr:VWA domain-containing protein [Candidatus Omnitrophota bacterium]